MDPPIWLDDEDIQMLAKMQEALMTRTVQATMWDAIRWVYRRLKDHPTSYRKYLRPSDRPYADGTAVTLRLTEEQRAFVIQIEELTRSPSRTEAYRLIIRMAGDWFVNNPVQSE